MCRPRWRARASRWPTGRSAVPDEPTRSKPESAGGAESAGGPELARAVLEAARARRAAELRRPAETGRAVGGRPRGYSGPGPDPRDPQPVGAVLAKLVKARGWQRQAAEARVFALWPDVVGADLAAHCRPVRLAGGELTVEAESTAW